ncbi:MAG: hypothetical protein JNK27_13355 [Chitinophagaceae bacterium]|nr:hypothetical protein [Chitinophagaceae bacterium]
MRNLFYRQLINGCLVFLTAWFFSFSAAGQTGEWKVWVKTSPCSGRFDWISVAKENPTGGGNFYYLANFIFPGTVCTNFGCTFAEATAAAATLRSSSEFFKYCCRDYSVWENVLTGKRSVVVGKFGTAGIDWRFVKGDLCCEEAEVLARVPGACSGATDQHTIVKNTKCWPGSYAAWNEQAKKVECYCNPGLVWNSTKTACIEPKADCSGYPGSYAAWNAQTQRMECFCPEGKTWNSTRTACIDNVSAVKCWPGSYAAWNPRAQRVECYCNPGLVWNSTKTACVDPKDLVKNSDCSAYLGSYAAWNDKKQTVECYCLEGKTWNSTKTACVDIVSTVKCWPGSYAAYNSQTRRVECFCNPGLVWNSTKTGCVDPKDLVKNTNCSGYPGSYPAWNEQTQSVECWCPTGKIWNSTRTACVDAININPVAGTWTLVSVTTSPENPGKAWNLNARGGTAHMDVGNGDKGDFQWTAPPQQFNSNGFTMSVNVQSKPAPNSRLAALIDVGGYGFTTDSPDKSAYATPPSGPANASRSFLVKPNTSSSEIEIRVELMWGDIKIYYKYKKN